jgi:hypothetical protein
VNSPMPLWDNVKKFGQPAQRAGTYGEVELNIYIRKKVFHTYGFEELFIIFVLFHLYGFKEYISYV